MNTSLRWTCGNDKALICKRHINNGAYGDVYEMGYMERGRFVISVRAQSPLKKAFARKLIRISNAIAEDVENEVKVVEALRKKGTHPNIIEILNHGWLENAGKVYFIDMELADLTLTEYIDYVFHNKRLDVTIPNTEGFNPVFSPQECSELQRLQTTFEIVRQVVGGLEFLHNSGHVHRDLKPQNVLYRCAENKWKLTDFGFTSEAMSTAKTTLAGRGTPGYRAPELFNTEKPHFSNRSDIWALGCIFHELATGRTIFSNDFRTFQYALGTLELSLHVSYMDMEFWQSHVSEALRDLLSREVQTRPSAQQVSRRLSVYVRILEMPTIANAAKAKMYPAYREWNDMVDGGCVTGGFLLELKRQYLVDGVIGIYSSLLEAITHVIPNATTHEVHLGSSGGQASTNDAALWKDVGEMLYANGADHAGTFLYKILLRENPEIVHASLHLAAMHGDNFSIRSLGLLGHDINQKDKDGRTPLSLAVANGHLEAVEFLVNEAGAEVESKDHEWGKTPLSYAAHCGHLDIVKFLVNEAGAEVESKDGIWGRTPLSLAASNGHLETVKFLVKEAGAKVKSKSNSGGMPLSFAAANGHLEVVEFLVNEADTDVESKDRWGQTALDLARRGAKGRWRPEECRAVAAWLMERERGGREDGD